MWLVPRTYYIIHFNIATILVKSDTYVIFERKTISDLCAIRYTSMDDYAGVGVNFIYDHPVHK